MSKCVSPNCKDKATNFDLCAWHHRQEIEHEVMNRAPRKSTRMRGTNVWLIQNSDGLWGGYLNRPDAEVYARRYGGSVRRAYVKVENNKEGSEVERLKAVNESNVRNYRELIAGAEAERDAWKTEAQRRLEDRKEVCDERDALKAELERLRPKKGLFNYVHKAFHDQTVADLRQQLAEAKAALRSKERWGRAHDDLACRIEALADEWDAEMPGNVEAARLRALLQPAKAETALDVLARAELFDDGGNEAYAISAGDMAKLKAMLEKEGDK